MRTQLFDPDDLTRVKEIQDAYKAQTLSEYMGREPLPGVETMDIPEWNEGDQFTAAMFPYMNAMLNIVEPFPEEIELMEHFAKLKIGKGKTFNLSDFDPDIQKAIEDNYTITFPDGQLPPVKSFWSLTMYDGKTQQMINNPLNRYLLNSSMLKDFVNGKDGALTFYIQKDSPGKAMENIWLPAPDGPFNCIWRLYGPEEAVLKGEWVNPPMVMVK